MTDQQESRCDTCERLFAAKGEYDSGAPWRMCFCQAAESGVADIVTDCRHHLPIEVVDAHRDDEVARLDALLAAAEQRAGQYLIGRDRANDDLKKYATLFRLKVPIREGTVGVEALAHCDGEAVLVLEAKRDGQTVGPHDWQTAERLSLYEEIRKAWRRGRCLVGEENLAEAKALCECGCGPAVWCEDCHREAADADGWRGRLASLELAIAERSQALDEAVAKVAKAERERDNANSLYTEAETTHHQALGDWRAQVLEAEQKVERAQAAARALADELGQARARITHLEELRDQAEAVLRDYEVNGGRRGQRFEAALRRVCEAWERQGWPATWEQARELREAVESAWTELEVGGGA